MSVSDDCSSHQLGGQEVLLGPPVTPVLTATAVKPRR